MTCLPGSNRCSAAFLPLVGIDTEYAVSAQWLKSADECIVQVAREVAQVCAEYMKNWSDGAS